MAINQGDADRHSRAMFEAHWGGASAGAEAQRADPAEQRRVASVVEVVEGSARVGSVLDVGCGAGVVLRALGLALGERLAVRVGCDAALSGLQALRAAGGVEVLRAQVQQLPFADRAFELVMSCDVLEHLPAGLLSEAVLELVRVAGRYLLINVPYEEDLGWSLLRCERCGHRYHRDHHQRRFSRADVEALLLGSGFRLRALRLSGGRVRRLGRMPPALGALLAMGYDATTCCERCGAAPAPPTAWQRRLRAALVWGNNGITKPLARWLSRDTEIIALFERS